jgi:hypothetical protein
MRTRIAFGAGAAALVLTVVSCKSDKSTGPGANLFAGTYSGIIAGATTSGTLTITVPTGSALVTPAGTLKIAGGSSYSLAGGFDMSTGMLSGVTAGPYAFTGGLASGKFSGSWTGPGATSGGYNLLPVPTGGTALTMCGKYIGSASGVWNLTAVNGLMVGEAAGSSGPFRLVGVIATTGGSPYAMTNITSPDDASVSASGALVTPANTASGIWAGGGGTGTWSGSTTGCN